MENGLDKDVFSGFGYYSCNYCMPGFVYKQAAKESVFNFMGCCIVTPVNTIFTTICIQYLFFSRAEPVYNGKSRRHNKQYRGKTGV